MGDKKAKEKTKVLRAFKDHRNETIDKLNKLLEKMLVEKNQKQTA